MTNEQYRRDLAEMIAADKKHLNEAVENGDRTAAHGFVDSIINNSRILADLGGPLEPGQ